MDTNQPKNPLPNFENKFALIRKEIQCLPEEQQAKLLKLVDSTEQLHKQLREMTAQALTCFGNLQFGIKYLIFDLDATKRENKELRKALGEIEGL
ncbi:MAG: hypothetical protein COT39_00960 [Parcubacteria group bacterium CG08_land_8_20_14_0_20_48_21]|nr:MAG: hypothetical protein AUK21_02210 [Parcubacteria group bacterium CG2_30_48_51]PIS33027.1 MAG: hypothetical protein COT39_00960 [Parcubacteria group bacterium CG08_land_8_20_14_0_20_48_21]PIW79104.1 MAG: hypothetical protein COZ99_02895 [Parcubacteria group bacterium CG_4_8_14_3_um_filter_48_16]PIY78217.1 MAG: hypothetical protein COY83_01055 [Parcubacteria group bacterium CG_4_10_14_0_8_um_filter_48_154]PIZ78063.1 MAG: hypothetical protein COY03_00510 [bacterium CG_4_10_14_0_2_um_filter_